MENFQFAFLYEAVVVKQIFVISCCCIVKSICACCCTKFLFNFPVFNYTYQLRFILYLNN